MAGFIVAGDPSAPPVDLARAVLTGSAPGGGLYLPAAPATLPPGFVDALPRLSRREICTTVAAALVGGDLPAAEIGEVVDEAVTFDAPLEVLSPSLAALELFHGPTFAFKDFGARFLAALVTRLRRPAPARGASSRRPLTVLVATSGDTGSAVGHAFSDKPGVRVVLLYPRGLVSPLQEAQLTTLPGAVTALEAEGTFDDCQALVKRAFADDALRAEVPLTSANSINIARLLPQTFYYFLGHAALPERKKPVVVSVPSGNLGNLAAGLLARSMGLPIKRFVAASNGNSAFPEFLAGAPFVPRPSVPTLSNAMDVGAPNNFPRLLALCGGDEAVLRGLVAGRAVSDEETVLAVREVLDRFGYVVDPHSAVGYRALSEALKKGEQGVFLCTAHPAKFEEVVRPVAGDRLEVPPALSNVWESPRRSRRIPATYDALVSVLHET